MADLISLFRYDQSAGESFLPYLILQTHQPETLQALSPDIMQLTDSIYVVDLHIVESYWRKAALQKKMKLNDFLDQVITKNKSESPIYLFCQHPFQGLVFFNHLKNLDSCGVFRTNALFSKKVYQNMGWYPWFVSARQIHDCIEAAQCLKKERQNFSSQLSKLSRFVERMDLQEFSNLEQAHFFEISRRFKGFIGLLWKWTFQKPHKSIDHQQASLLTFEHYEKLDGFPWIPYFIQPPTKIDNILDYPVSEWEALCDSLLYDFEKLSQQDKLRAPYKVIEMRWRLTLFDMSQVEKTLQFKHPLCLEREQERGFSTLEKQFQFAFDQFRNDLQSRDQELQWVNTPLLVSWSIEVSKGLILTEKTDWLDLEEQMHKMHHQDLMNLNNKVKTGLQSFKVFETFIPGLDFAHKDLLEEVTASEPEALLHLPRPFYILPEEEEISADSIKHWQFLDRTSSDWWNRQDALDSYRDCFLCELKDQEFVFAYRNYQGRWFRYGF